MLPGLFSFVLAYHPLRSYSALSTPAPAVAVAAWLMPSARRPGTPSRASCMLIEAVRPG